MVQSFQKQVVVVGAGPAGLAAAIRATEGGAAVTVIDEARAPGGQIYRQPPPEFRLSEAHPQDKDRLRGQALLRKFEAVEGQLDFVGETAVLGLFENKTLLLHRAGGTFEMRAESLILATGAHERTVPFPGWTLPGVYTAGGCQIMLKSQRVLPGRRVLVAGTGPLLLVLAAQLARAGAHVAAVLEASSLAGLALAPHRLLSHWGLLREGIGYLRELKRAGIPLLQRHAIVEARGEGRVSEAVIARLGRDWHPIPGSERITQVDAVAVGFGFVPNTELSRMAGCDHVYNKAQGGWVPARNRDMETSLPGICAVGDGAGVAGALVAELEGRLAALAVLKRLELLDQGAALGEARRLRRRLRGLARFRKALDRVSLLRPGLLSLCAPDTVVCRCEEVPLSVIWDALAQGSRSVDNLKRRTRAGMGFCQGRTCLPYVAALAAHAGQIDEAQAGWHRPRPPLRPVPLSALASRAEAPETQADDAEAPETQADDAEAV